MVKGLLRLFDDWTDLTYVCVCLLYIVLKLLEVRDLSCLACGVLTTWARGAGMVDEVRLTSAPEESNRVLIILVVALIGYLFSSGYY